MQLFSDRILSFYFSLKPSFPLPAGVEIMNPYADNAIRKLTSQFYHKYYNDNRDRIYIIGINAGRFGGGVTGIPFTDPIRLAHECGICHHLPMRPELSSEFIYSMIRTYGGNEKFFSRYFLTAVCPLGFTFRGKNLNYYDTKELLRSSKAFIEESLSAQVQAGARRELCFCLGQGSNYQQLMLLNEDLHLFKEIIPLPHPRWILQYKRKKAGHYVEEYVEKFSTYF